MTVNNQVGVDRYCGLSDRSGGNLQLPGSPVASRHRFRPGPKMLRGDDDARSRVEFVNFVL
jgi:hypothetical protein